jgi:hypothetical protein
MRTGVNGVRKKNCGTSANAVWSPLARKKALEAYANIAAYVEAPYRATKRSFCIAAPHGVLQFV